MIVPGVKERCDPVRTVVTRDPVGRAPTRRHLAALVERSPQILCIADLQGQVLWCNESMENALGYTRAQLQGAWTSDLVHPDDLHAFGEAARVLGSGVGPSDLQARFRCRDGSWRWLEWTAQADPSRRLTYGSARDVTERRAADEVLRTDVVRLKLLFESAPASMSVKDLAGRYLMVNTQWSRVTGIPMQQALGSTASKSWPSEVTSIAAHERLLLQTGRPQVTQERMHTRSGVRDYIVCRFLVRDQTGAPYAIAGVAVDVTDRTAQERSMAGRARLLTAVLQASPDIITLVDGQGRILQVSDADRSVLGRKLTKEAEPGSELLAQVHPDDVDVVTRRLHDLIRGSVADVRVRHRVRHAEGHWVTLDSHGQAMRDDVGSVVGAVIVSRDMTARLASERRLCETREAAEHSSRAKSEFLSRMSHELRTPLNAVLGFSQLLQMDDLSERQQEAVSHIMRAGRHLLDLIDEVLDISRIESGHLDLDMEPMAARDVVSDAVQLIGPLAERAGVSVRPAIDVSCDHRILADRQRIMQVLLNLLSNAVKYNKRDGRVTVTCEPATGGRVRVVVSDTGRGIRPENAGRVFIPFDRLGAEQSEVEGAGVGLALSRHLVERMGGQLGFESVPDVGTSFFVELRGAPATFGTIGG